MGHLRRYDDERDVQLRRRASNQDIGDWKVEASQAWFCMFQGASAFNQSLGWCVDDGVCLKMTTRSTFARNPCESTVVARLHWPSLPDKRKRQGTDSGCGHRRRGRGRRALPSRRRLLVLPSAQGLHDG